MKKNQLIIFFILVFVIKSSCTVNEETVPSFIEIVKNQEAVDQSMKTIYATFDENGFVTINGTKYSHIEDISYSSANYTSSNGKTIVVQLNFINGIPIGATFEVIFAGQIESKISTRFVSDILKEKFLLLENRNVIAQGTSTVLGEISDDGIIFVPTANFSTQSGVSVVFDHYVVEDDALVYRYIDSASFKVTFTVTGRIGTDTAGTIQLNSDAVKNVDFVYDADMETAFKQNLHGTYTLIPNTILDYKGNFMYFQGSDIRFNVSVNNDNLYFMLYVNGSPSTNTLRKIAVYENDTNSGGFEQMVIINNATNAILKNPIILLDGSWVYDDDVPVIINPNTGTLTLLGTPMATKNP